MNQVTLTIPYEHAALHRAAVMLNGMAVDLVEAKAGSGFRTPDEAMADQLYTEPAPTTGRLATAAEVEEAARDAIIEASGVPAEMLAPEPTPAEIFSSEPDQAPDTSAADVELDARGLPWDARIHTSAKSKKVDGKWKNKRGVDKDLVFKVEAELTALMGTPTENVASTPPPPPPPAAPAATGKVTTLPELVTAITSNQIGNEVVQGALDTVGIGNIVLLGARPDLIPAVAQRLGL
jgi:hypothetical protein